MPADRSAKMKAIRAIEEAYNQSISSFLSNILSYVSQFNLPFQSSSPSLHCLLREMLQLLLRILNKFIVPICFKRY